MNDISADQSQPRRYSLAYKLFEYLVVLVICVVLFSFCAPHSHSREKARQASCASNMKQIGLAFALYRADYDDTYPAFGSQTARIKGTPPMPASLARNAFPQTDWRHALRPYLKSDDLYRCPSDRSAPNPGQQDAKIESGRKLAASYAVNGWAERGLKQSDVTCPAGWILLAERDNGVEVGSRVGPVAFDWWMWQGTSPGVWPPTAQPDPLPSAKRDLALTRHGHGANWLYGDGHLKWRMFDDLWKPGEENAFWPNPPK